jgi:hypothetical protein
LMCRRSDPRTRRDRTQRQVDAWRKLLPHLVDNYLAWKHHGVPSDPMDNETWELKVLSLTGMTSASSPTSRLMSCHRIYKTQLSPFQ